ncbi:hydantoin racemase [Xylariomycetidae sp. FL2044]|nr:hydantoin racemase [Xylariomycetidae sp. FL2044]
MESLRSVTGTSTRPIKILLINPNSTPSMTESCLQSVQATLPPHVTVYGFTCPRPGPSAIEGKVDATLSAADSFRALAPILRSPAPSPPPPASSSPQPDLTQDQKNQNHHRFDGLLVACFSAHPLIAMLREEYAQPVLGIMEASLYASRMCGQSLGVVTTSERSSGLHGLSIAADYGLGRFSAAGCETGHVSVLELESRPRAEVYASLCAAAKRLVAKGADCICLGCAGMTGMRQAVSEAVGMHEGGTTMVVDGVAVGVQFLVALAQEGLGTPKSGVYRSAAEGRERRGQDWL